MAREGTAVRPGARKILIFFALTLVYVVAGKLGLLLAVPPGYATAVFLPAGIAVAAMLVGGAETLPATFTGSLLLNAWRGYTLKSELDGTALAIAFLIATASALQAWIGGTVLRRTLGVPTPLDNGRDLTRFFVLSPLCCLVSATLSHAGMWLLGTVESTDLATSWFTWWVGDTLGVLFMLPLVLVLVGEPRTLWRQRRVTVALPMLVFFVLFATMFERVTSWERDQSLLEYRLVSQQAADRIEAALNEQGLFLDQLERSFVSATPLSRETFQRLAERLPQHFPTIQAVEWAPRVTAGERKSFEASQGGVLSGFAVTERGPDGKMRPAPARALYYPVTYVEPAAGNEEAVGFDLWSNPERRAGIQAALTSGTTVATAPIRLVQEHGSQTSILLLHAVGEGATGQGVILVVLRFGDFLGALADPAKATIGLRLVDSDTGGVLFDSLPREPFAGGFERTISFGTRHYVIATTPTAAYFRAHPTWQSWAVLARGVLGTALLGALLLLGTGQSHRFEQLVGERTAQLELSHERLRQAQKMEAVGQLTGGIAHDFNNLLTIVTGNLELLAASVTGARERRLITAAQHAADRGARLTQSLLAFARRQVLRPEPADANRIITEFEPILHQAAGGLADIECRLSPDLDRCLVDATQFQSALLNLVSNARDAMAGNRGKITIETENVEVADEPAAQIAGGRYVLVTVTDTGSGMSEAVAGRAFEPFYTTKEIGKGSGLGLSQVYGFAQQSGGFVRLVSAEGVGTTVRLYLPRAELPSVERGEANGAARPPVAERTGEAVLVVDDDAEVRSLIAGMVGDLGYRVMTAKDGPSALSLIESDPGIDLLVTDYAMPSMAGDTLVRRAREVRHEIKALLVSGFAMEAGDDTPGGLPLLCKPFHQDELARAIRDVLRGDDV